MPTATDYINNPTMQQIRPTPGVNEELLRYADVINPVDWEAGAKKLISAASGDKLSTEDAYDALDTLNRVPAMTGVGAGVMEDNANALSRAIAEQSFGAPKKSEGGLSAFKAINPDRGARRAGLAALLNLPGTAADEVASKYTTPAKLALPLIGAIAGGVGDAGVGRGILRGTGTAVGAHVGGKLGKMLADYASSSDSVRGLDPKMQAALTIASLAGGNILGGLAGYKATKALSKSDEEESNERREKYASIDKAYTRLMDARK